ncbi:hypothetical protein L1987_43284 [Smallanthus sonchifolius]|uniref:Uncharacterized protein n=1 Tax=Smallanthus sonchifolius TaxID=185202 RepID=A0ACB9GMD9_9ASTR|nr:hypothetical protein L1987_43284 [Smallanthus sonchifolius]
MISAEDDENEHESVEDSSMTLLAYDILALISSISYLSAYLDDERHFIGLIRYCLFNELNPYEELVLLATYLLLSELKGGLAMTATINTVCKDILDSSPCSNISWIVIQV